MGAGTKMEMTQRRIAAAKPGKSASMPAADPARGLHLPAGSIAAFARATTAIHSADFHDHLLQAVGSLVEHDQRSIMRYSRFSAPDFLACQDYTPEFVRLYNTEYYRYDPYYLYWKETGQPGVLPLSQISNQMGLRSRYVNAVLAEADISDEVSVFLPPVGGCALALFLDRGSGRFSAADIARLKAVYPLIVGLQEAHIACFDSDSWPVGEGMGATLPGGRPMRILDRFGQEVFQNAAWRALQSRIGDHLDLALQRLQRAQSGQVAIEGGQVLHRAALPAEFSLAPEGAIDMVELPGRTPLHPDHFDLPPALAAPLTRREIDIVRLILQGHPSSSIAAKLGLSRGTVKNHRLRLYEKLDITSEREIFLKYIAASMTGDI